MKYVAGIIAVALIATVTGGLAGLSVSLLLINADLTTKVIILEKELKR
jgi:hypothetical protein